MTQDSSQTQNDTHFKTENLDDLFLDKQDTQNTNTNKWSPAQRRKAHMGNKGRSGRSLELDFQREKMQYLSENLANIPVPNNSNTQSLNTLFRDPKNQSSIKKQVSDDAEGKGNNNQTGGNALQAAQQNYFAKLEQAQNEEQQKLQKAQISATILRKKKKKKRNLAAKISGGCGAGLFWYLLST